MFSFCRLQWVIRLFALMPIFFRLIRLASFLCLSLFWLEIASFSFLAFFILANAFLTWVDIWSAGWLFLVSCTIPRAAYIIQCSSVCYVISNKSFDDVRDFTVWTNGSWITVNWASLLLICAVNEEILYGAQILALLPIGFNTAFDFVSECVLE